MSIVSSYIGNYLDGVALEAARALENGDYKKVRSLYRRLRQEGFGKNRIKNAFRSQGAALWLLPQSEHNRVYSMLFATKG